MATRWTVGNDPVLSVDACRLVVGTARWAYADEHAYEINSHWQQALGRNPGYFNGTIQILIQHSVEGDTFAGTFATTDFASFLYWRDRADADLTVRDCFGCAILRSMEGHLLLGVQAAGNLNAGRAYCPGGFIDPADIAGDGTIDIDGSIAREIAEETGLWVTELQRKPGYLLIAAGASIAIGITYQSALPADELRNRILQHLAQDVTPELADILIVRGPSDLDQVPTSPYVPALVGALV